MSDSPQRGLPYPGWPLYHATAAYDALMEHGFLTRAELAERAGGRERHFAGGGTSYAISMTLDPRVAEAIVIGLRVISRLVKGTMSLGELLIAGQKQAPTGTADVIREWRLTPERVLLYDEGLYPFHTRGLAAQMTLGEAHSRGDVLIDSAFEASPDRGYGDEVERVPEGAVDVVAFFGHYTEDLPGAAPDRQAIEIAGWAPKMEVAAVSRYGDGTSYRDNARFVEMYKRMLAMSTFDAEEVYDPLFFLTSLEAMRELNEDDLWVVETDCEADWLCISFNDAKRLGLTSEFHAHPSPDWYHTCEHRLEDVASGGRYGSRAAAVPRGWAQPDPSDTVVYLGRAMAEVRVYDPSLLTNVRGFKSLDDIEDELGADVIAYPWFRARGN